jgi:NTP pyrophosphatase (non-canonical NTP hydrolase)
MELRKLSKTVLDICVENGWELNPYKDLCLLTEETGEVAREIRRLEDGRQRPDEIEPEREITVDNLASEIGDLLFPLAKIAAYYGVSLEYAIQLHVKKMGGRYSASAEDDVTSFLNTEVYKLNTINKSIKAGSPDIDTSYLITAFRRLETLLTRLTPIQLQQILGRLESGISSSNDIKILYDEVLKLKQMAGEPI